jgi:hypothetical protein
MLLIGNSAMLNSRAPNVAILSVLLSFEKTASGMLVPVIFFGKMPGSRTS